MKISLPVRGKDKKYGRTGDAGETVYDLNITFGNIPREKQKKIVIAFRSAIKLLL
jgi:hypothetical protein